MFPPDTQVQFWLQWFVSRDAGRHSFDQWFQADDGSKVATDGRMAVSTKDETEVAPFVFDYKASPQKSIPEMLAAPAKKTMTLPHDDMVKRFGTFEMIRCGCNDGQMKHDCDCKFCTTSQEECDTCEGTGWKTKQEARHVACWGMPFDANCVAYLIEHAPAAESYIVEIVKYKSNNLIRIKTERWSFVLTEMTKNVLTEYPCPEVMENYTPCAS